MNDRTIVVGAGSAGAVIAARLSERSDVEILLLEAGPDYPELPLPSDLADGTRNSMREHDWGYRHRPTPEQTIPFDFPRGRVVGGSSAVNTCVALRGQPYDYDEWAARGLPEWSFEQCLPAFKRLEHDCDFDNAWHGRGGPIPIRRHTPSELSPWQAAFVEACRDRGMPRCDDHNDPTQTGVGPHAMNKIRGHRMSAAQGYLTPEVRRRENFTLRADTLVRRVLFEGRRAIGVEVETGGVVERLEAGRVVLSAGAIATPGILLRSGVGPRRSVERMGALLVAEVPAVGAKLLDHPGAAVILAPRKGIASVNDPLLQTLGRYTSRRSPYPNDMQVQPGSVLAFPLVSFPAVTLMCCVGKPKGHGTITWASADPHEKPRIESSLLVHPDDRERAAEAMELVWRCTRTRAMKGMATFLWPSESVLRSRSETLAWIPRSTGSGYHPCGTVPMGDPKDPDAATDGRGRVRETTGLVVADASLMPTIPSANTNLTTLMIGERFGAWLREAN